MPTIRVMTAADVPAAMRLKDALGWNQSSDDWHRLLAASPAGCFVAEENGTVVGTAATISYQGRFAWVGMMVVDVGHRGRGLGRALLEETIRYLDAVGLPCIKLDATPQGQPLYRKLGFEPEYGIERWEVRRPRAATRRRSIPVPMSDDVFALDSRVFGSDRSTLMRSVAEAAPELALVERSAGGVGGYAFGRHGTVADQLGPWMAMDARIADDVLREFLKRTTREVVFVDCTAPNPWAIETVRAAGFHFARPLTRMYRGTNWHPGEPRLLGAILGPEFG